MNGRSVLDECKIAVVGATGAVGLEVLSILAGRGVPSTHVISLASERSAGTKLAYGRDQVIVKAVSAEAFDGVEYAIFAADGSTSTRWAAVAVQRGVTVIDNSSAFRMADGVPLVVPEINGGVLDGDAGKAQIIANPNCSTILLLLALEPLRAAFGVCEIVVSTYQAVSGAGIAAMDELREQTRDVLAGKAAQPKVFTEPCAFNLFSHDSSVDVETGQNGEETKIIAETRKIWNDAEVRVIPTCVRVPVLRAHTQAVTVRLGRAAIGEEVGDAMSRGVGLRVMDDRQGNRFPTPAKASGADEVLVGRIRAAEPIATGATTDRFCLLLSGDQRAQGRSAQRGADRGTRGRAAVVT